MPSAAAAHGHAGDDSRLVEQILSDLQSRDLVLPQMPQAAGEVIAIASSPDGDAKRLAAIIQSDPTLAAEMLRIANSPAFRGAAVIVSLQQAIARMGQERVRDVTLAIAMRADLFNGGAFQSLLREVWSRSLATAGWARELAKACRLSVEMAYLGGLLHAIGAPLVLGCLAKRAPTMDDEAARRIAGQLAVTAGQQLVHAWNMPAQFAEIIAQCRNPSCSDPVARLVAAAMVLTDANDQEPAQLAALPALQRINLYEEDLKKVCEQRDRIDAMVEALAL